ncbi:MAG: 50S ribosomal protein L22 [bacterium]|jgi:large subunit ribosomal protein L22
MQVQAIHKFLRTSPLKIRRFAQLIKGKRVEAAESILLVQPSPTCQALARVLKSAVSNGENNHGLERENLFVRTVLVDDGPRMKRFRARARGRPGPILKRSSHVTIVLDEFEPSDAEGGEA